MSFPSSHRIARGPRLAGLLAFSAALLPFAAQASQVTGSGIGSVIAQTAQERKAAAATATATATAATATATTSKTGSTGTVKSSASSSRVAASGAQGSH